MSVKTIAFITEEGTIYNVAVFDIDATEEEYLLHRENLTDIAVELPDNLPVGIGNTYNIQARQFIVPSEVTE